MGVQPIVVPQSLAYVLNNAGDKSNVDFNYLVETAQRESALNPSAKAGKRTMQTRKTEPSPGEDSVGKMGVQEMWSAENRAAAVKVISASHPKEPTHDEQWWSNRLVSVLRFLYACCLRADPAQLKTLQSCMGDFAPTATEIVEKLEALVRVLGF